ncbi:MAG: glycosyltransferase family 4 protein [Victivallales bacterium]|nr:glycosyltransferase family 4 protein [Victivallales bacterium]
MELDVLHVTEACGGGVRRHLQLILPALMARGLRCGLFAFGSRLEAGFLDDLEDFRQQGCQVKILQQNSNALFNCWEAMRQLRELVKEWKPGVVHAHAFQAGVVVRMGLRKQKDSLRILYSPHAFAIHPALPWWKRTFDAFTERLLDKWTDGFVFVGQSEVREALELGLLHDHFHLAQNGLPMDFSDHIAARDDARKELGLEEGIRVVAAPCRLERQKGLECLVESATRLPKDVQIILYGEGSERDRLARLIRRLGVEQRVHFGGQVNNLRHLLRAFDVIVLPSWYEGLSYALLEACGAAVPIVASDIPANVANPKLRDCLGLFRAGDSDSLALAIHATLDHPGEAENCAKNACSILHSQFTLAAQIKKLIWLYRQGATFH